MTQLRRPRIKRAIPASLQVSEDNTWFFESDIYRFNNSHKRKRDKEKNQEHAALIKIKRQKKKAKKLSCV